MKKSLALPLIALLSLPVFAGGDSASTTSVYDDPAVSVPVMGTDESSDMIQAEEESFEPALDPESVEQQRMEDSSWEESQWEDDSWEEQRMEDMSSSEPESGAIDYSDRTRTNRARNAINTGSNASDDK